MILAFDTWYYDNQAKTVCLGFVNWEDAEPQEIFTEILDSPAAYEPGAFYKRELPCIISLLKQIDLQLVSVIVVDGFVVLDDAGKPGLGGRLYEYLDQKIPVIGVAKTNFAQNIANKRAVVRGQSSKPLFITALGMDLDAAADHVKNMHGDYRLPTLLKELDRLTKS
ncbi:MAG: endonuclease V [Saprospiraceae bacterium]